MKKVYLSSDHGGYELKDKMVKYLNEKGYEIVDLGPFTDKESVSYAKYGLELANKVVADKDSIGIGVCGTGLGISYAMNRIKGGRAARVTSVEDAHLAKLHNNANMLALGGRQISFEEAKAIFDEFEKTEFEGGRHLSRINELDK